MLSTRQLRYIGSAHPVVISGKDVLKICSKFTGEHPSRSVISKKLLSKFIEITLRHGCSPVDLLHVFRTPFPKNSSGWLLLCNAVIEEYLGPCQTSITELVTKIVND